MRRPAAIAILFSAPVFEIFEGNPYEKIENLATLGPDILPYDGPFDAANWQTDHTLQLLETVQYTKATQSEAAL